MPCRSGLEVDEPFDYERYSHIIDEEVIKLRKEIRRLNELSDLEKTAFNSFMTVFLCKAMDIVVSNFDYKFINSDLEWWYKEHKSRDANKDVSTLSKKEVQQKLLEIQEKYRVN
jgi:flagellar motor component MotA